MAAVSRVNHSNTALVQNTEDSQYFFLRVPAKIATYIGDHIALFFKPSYETTFYNLTGHLFSAEISSEEAICIHSLYKLVAENADKSIIKQHVLTLKRKYCKNFHCVLREAINSAPTQELRDYLILGINDNIPYFDDKRWLCVMNDCLNVVNDCLRFDPFTKLAQNQNDHFIPSSPPAPALLQRLGGYYSTVMKVVAISFLVYGLYSLSFSPETSYLGCLWILQRYWFLGTHVFTQVAFISAMRNCAGTLGNCTFNM